MKKVTKFVTVPVLHWPSLCPQVGLEKFNCASLDTDKVIFLSRIGQLHSKKHVILQKFLLYWKHWSMKMHHYANHQIYDSRSSLQGKVTSNTGRHYGTSDNVRSKILLYSASILPIFLYLGSEASEQFSAELKKAKTKKGDSKWQK